MCHGSSHRSTPAEAQALLSAVAEGELAAAAVDQASLKVLTSEVSTTQRWDGVTNNGGEHLTPAGGAYMFWPRVKSAAGSVRHHASVTEPNSDQELTCDVANLGTSYVANIWIGSNGGTEAFAEFTYITTSPPYDLGDGDVPLFAFVKVDKSGKVISTSIAPDPPWANNGPTSLRATRIDSKTGKRFVRKVVPGGIRTHIDTGGDAESYVLGDEVEITQALKQADMPMIPHPFKNVDSGHSVILLDPVGSMCQGLCDLHSSGDSVATLLHEGYLKLGNTALKRACPPGVMPVSVSWK